MEERLYIFSLALQACGALLLLIQSILKTKKQIIKSYFSEYNAVEEKDGYFILKNNKKVAKIIYNIYINRMSFICIAIGYGITVLGNIEKQNIDFIFCSTIIYTFFLMIGCVFVSLILSHLFVKRRCKIKESKLHGFGIKVNVISGHSVDRNGIKREHVRSRIY